MAPASETQAFLDTYQREHETTMKVLRAYPADKLDLQPHPRCKSARELAWIFVMERRLGTALYHDAFANAAPSGKPPEAPQSWDELLSSLEVAHVEFADLIRSASPEELGKTTQFFVGPKRMGDIPRMDVLWMLLHDQIHHRRQLSIYLRMADAKVPSIYGPSGDEPWI